MKCLRNAPSDIAALLLIFLLKPLMAQGNFADPCPMHIEVTRSGDFFTNRFHGRYRTSPKLLESDLKGGCYNDSNPAPVSSVTVKVASGVPVVRMELLYRILDENGWPKSKVSVQK